MPLQSHSDTEIEFTIRLHNAAQPDSEVPFAVLASVLDNMQQAFYLLAMEREGKEINQRARIPTDIERRYVLRALVPQDGSYELPVSVGDPGAHLFAPSYIREAHDRFRRFSTALGNGSFDAVREVVPNRDLRNRILRRFQSMIPKPGSGWELELGYNGHGTINLGVAVVHQVASLLKQTDSSSVTNIVTGKLVKIDFGARAITLLYPVTQRELVCYYDPSIEERLLQNRRELVQVIGTVVLDDQDNPKQITGVVEILDVDLSPFELSEFRYSGYRLKFHTPLEIIPTLDESQQVFCLEYSELGIDVYASTREELDFLLEAEIDVLWRNYALADDKELTPDAQELKDRLLGIIEEIRNAT